MQKKWEILNEDGHFTSVEFSVLFPTSVLLPLAFNLPKWIVQQV